MATSNYQSIEKGVQAYYEASARQCPLHSICDCCTCRCCGFCTSICWVIIGVAFAILYFSLNNIDLTDYIECPLDDDDFTGECCSYQLGGDTIFIDSPCDKVRATYTTLGVNAVG